MLVEDNFGRGKFKLFTDTAVNDQHYLQFFCHFKLIFHQISDSALLARANFDPSSYDAEKERERAEERERIFERYTQARKILVKPKFQIF